MAAELELLHLPVVRRSDGTAEVTMEGDWERLRNHLVNLDSKQVALGRDDDFHAYAPQSREEASKLFRLILSAAIQAPGVQVALIADPQGVAAFP
jgi:hypothetical protein